jgi:hypothetical protein
MALAGSTEQLTIGWFNPGILTRPSSAVTSAHHRDRLRFVEMTAQGLIVASLATACAVDRVGNPLIDPLTKDRGWRMVHIVPENGQPADSVSGAVRQSLGRVGLNEVNYRAAEPGTSEVDPYVQVLLDAAGEAGFRDPTGLLPYCPVLAEEQGIDFAPLAREYDESRFAGAIALF